MHTSITCNLSSHPSHNYENRCMYSSLAFRARHPSLTSYQPRKRKPIPKVTKTHASNTTMATEVAESSHLTFFDLPAEVRNTIYSFIEDDDKDISVVLPKSRGDFPYPVTRASRQFRQESLRLLYSRRRFRFDFYGIRSRDVALKWLCAACEDTIRAMQSFYLFSQGEKGLSIELGNTMKPIYAAADPTCEWSPKAKKFIQVKRLVDSLPVVDGRQEMNKSTFGKIMHALIEDNGLDETWWQ